MGDWLFSLEEIASQLAKDPSASRVRYAIRHGTMRFGVYAPLSADPQQPHAQDELYVVVSGGGAFIKNGERRAVALHDAIFVEAGAEHRFVDFSDDFAVMVIFWGPTGGETT